MNAFKVLSYVVNVKIYEVNGSRGGCRPSFSHYSSSNIFWMMKQVEAPVAWVCDFSHKLKDQSSAKTSNLMLAKII